MFYLADGVPAVLKRVRENLMQGATHIKLMAGGGVTSAYDPIHTIQFTDEDLEGIEFVEVWVDDWGRAGKPHQTYVLLRVARDRVRAIAARPR